jgi:hypothetical protein
MYYVIEAQNAKTDEKIIVILTGPAFRPGREGAWLPHCGRSHGWDVWNHDGPYTLHGAEVVVKMKWPQSQKTKPPAPHSSALCALGAFSSGDVVFAYEAVKKR